MTNRLLLPVLLLLLGMRLSKILLPALMCCFLSAYSQCVVPYYDITSQLYAYDNGETHFLEPSLPASVKVGKNYVAYINGNSSRLRLYYGSKNYVVCENAAEFWATDNWFVYKNYGLLGVLYKNELKPLDKMVMGEYWIGDSIISWVSNFNEIKMFYEGQIRSIEAFNIQQKRDGSDYVYSNAKMSDNIFAYVDQSNVFKVFYHGQVIQLETFEPTMYIPGRDMVLYVDNINNLKVFCKGQTYETNINGITNYWLGEGFFVYYTLGGQLAVWKDGEEKILAQDRPKDLIVQRNMIAFTDKSNNFYIWYNDKLELVERFQPKTVQAYRNFVVYQDQDGRLKGYYYGKQINVSDQIVSKYNLYNETVVYSLIRGETTIWCNEKSQTINQ